MKMSPFLLKSGAVFLLMLISMGAYAIPLAYNDITLAQDESGHDKGISSISGVASKTDEMIALLLVSSYLGRPPGDEKVLSLGIRNTGSLCFLSSLRPLACHGPTEI